MNNFLVICIFSLLFLHSYGQQYGDCLGVPYKVINDYRRSTKYVPTNETICDSDLESRWYRFTSEAGGEMPTSCVGVNAVCGTYVPVSYRGLLPNNYIGEITTGSAEAYYMNCYIIPDLFITVKNCSDYLIYFLSAVPGCSMAYCAGDRSKCRPGESSQDGFSPCINILNVTVTSYLTQVAYYNSSKQRNEIYFHCNISMDGPDLTPSVLTEVQFMANDKVVQTEILAAKVLLGKMQELGPWKMGDTITCNARALDDSRYSEWSADSNAIPTGMTVDSTYIEVTMPSDGTPVTGDIVFHLISPLYCPYQASCNMYVYFSTPLDQAGLRDDCYNSMSFFPQIYLNTACYATVNYDTQTQPQKIQVSVVVDDYISTGNDYSYRDYKISGRTDKYVFEHIKWSNYSLPVVTIRAKRATTEGKDNYCYAWPDPHFSNYVKRTFDFHGTGEFVVFKHKTYDVQVNWQFEGCGNGITCPCGVGVRVDRRVATLSRCGGGTLQVDFYENGCQNITSGLRLIQDGTYYEIHVATGGRVTVKTDSSPFSIWYYASTLDLLANEGACGMVGQPKLSELIKRDGTTVCTSEINNQECIDDFWLDWRATPEEELMDGGVKGNDKYECTSGYTRSCSCMTEEGQTAINCTAIPVGDVCARWPDTLLNYVTSTDANAAVSSRHGIKTSNHNYFPTLRKNKRNKSYNQSEAYDRCYKAIYEGQAGQVSSGILPSEDIIAAVNFCTYDLVATGDEIFIDIHSEGLMTSTTTTMWRNASLWSNSSETGEMVPPADVASQLCPNSCSGHGNCSSTGVCLCEQNFAGSDCSIDLSQSPSNLYLATGDVCDLQSSSCTSVEIYGEAFTPTSYCRFRSVSVEGLTPEDPFPITVNNIYLTIYSVRCPLPTIYLTAYGYNISVSNNNILFSEEMFFLAYDSTCRSCDIANTPPCTSEDLCAKDKKKI